MNAHHSRPEAQLQTVYRRSHAAFLVGMLRVAACFVGMAALAASAGIGQQTPPPRAPHPILLPEANNPPDANAIMLMKEQKARKQNFDAANAERKRQMDDESAKLLILAKDLKAQTDKAGGGPLSPRLVREAEVIELLAHDLKARMKMTVGGG